MAQIRTKAEFFQLWEAGLLGNRLRIWRDPAVALQEGADVVGLREVGRGGGGAYAPATRATLAAVCQEWRAAGREFMICEAAPDHRATIQGEVCRTVGGLGGLLGRVVGGKRMRDSLRDGDLKPVRGAQVQAILATYMDPSSRDDLEALLDRYDGATVEFTCYELNVGMLRGRNTIFWEVRNY